MLVGMAISVVPYNRKRNSTQTINRAQQHIFQRKYTQVVGIRLSLSKDSFTMLNLFSQYRKNMRTNRSARGQWHIEVHGAVVSPYLPFECPIYYTYVYVLIITG